MTGSMKDALAKALAASKAAEAKAAAKRAKAKHAGVAAPLRVAGTLSVPASKKKAPAKAETDATWEALKGVTVAMPSHQVIVSRPTVGGRQGGVQAVASKPIATRPTPKPKQTPQKRISPPKYQHLRSPTPRPAVPPSVTTVSVADDARLVWGGQAEAAGSLLAMPALSGSSTQLHKGKHIRQRELVLGLDFGTSCVKVVFGDRVLKQAFAVRFNDEVGIGAFLLPARLREHASDFSLVEGSTVHRDLKLSLLARPNDKEVQLRVVAFLALVIRRARAWLFTEHAEVYAETDIVWKLSLGRPVDRLEDDEKFGLYARLAAAAWMVAGTQEHVSRKLCESALSRPDIVQALSSEVAIDVVPEIAAQIYGFVMSESFDKKKQNIFLMVDVGAGTVDASLFAVKPAARGRWDFDLYTSVVEPHGVMNLHRHRVDWWQKKLQSIEGRAQSLRAAIGEIKFHTEQQLIVPETYEAYFEGVDVSHSGRETSPDEFFMRSKVTVQVKGHAFYRAMKNGLLAKEHLTDMPFFLCGGGARLGYYKRLERVLSKTDNVTWLRAHRRELALPKDLRAPGLERSEFDRLSVAYGLSFLDVGKVARALPMPRLARKAKSHWQDNYVGMDQV